MQIYRRSERQGSPAGGAIIEHVGQDDLEHLLAMMSAGNLEHATLSPDISSMDAPWLGIVYAANGHFELYLQVEYSPTGGRGMRAVANLLPGNAGEMESMTESWVLGGKVEVPVRWTVSFHIAERIVREFYVSRSWPDGVLYSDI